ncbi:lipid II:glycine glycyltransferase FemX [Streptococcus jiangjianxini]|uniref:lipid II:glycine glycyltransferase FemX n=1 Tax=Streptococcus jiangjianxini TaxID=3161189 RepID=UPI0032EDA40B
MKIKIVSDDEYRLTQENYDNANFLQSSEISQLQEERHNFVKVERLLFVENNNIVGQAILNYRRKYKVFTEALVVQGPLLNYQNQGQVEAAISCLEQHVKKNKAIHLMIHPFIINQIKNEALEIASDQIQMDTISTLQGLGFTRDINIEDMSNGMGQAFVKNLTHFSNIDDIVQSFPPSLKRDIKKFKALEVKVVELDQSRLDEFYNILSKTGKRKNFSVQDFQFFQLLKKYLGERAKFMLAYLDVPAYLNYLEENINHFQVKIDELNSGKVTKKTKGLIVAFAYESATLN